MSKQWGRRKDDNRVYKKAPINISSKGKYDVIEPPTRGSSPGRVTVQYRTPKQRFERLSIDNILKSVTSNNSIIPKLRILRERAEEKGLESEVQKIDKVITNLTGINDELLDIKSNIERRGEQPSVLPIGFKDENELDRRTTTKSLVDVTQGKLYTSGQSIEAAKGTMRNLRAGALDDRRASEAGDIKGEIERLARIGMKIRDEQEAIKELTTRMGEE